MEDSPTSPKPDDMPVVIAPSATFYPELDLSAPDALQELMVRLEGESWERLPGIRVDNHRRALSATTARSRRSERHPVLLWAPVDEEV